VYYTAQPARIATRTRDAGLPEGRRPDGGAGRREAEPEGGGGGGGGGRQASAGFSEASRLCASDARSD